MESIRPKSDFPHLTIVLMTTEIPNMQNSYKAYIENLKYISAQVGDQSGYQYRIYWFSSGLNA